MKESIQDQNTTYWLRLANLTDQEVIWSIFQDAIERRKSEGSAQWQDGYPNESTIQSDIKNEQGYVLTNGQEIIGYCAILINNEPTYLELKGKWLTNSDFVVYHRVAIANSFLKQGFSKLLLQLIEEFARKHKIYSLKADTNFDNYPMLHLFESLGYTYCGKVYFRGSERLAYEKVLYPLEETKQKVS